MIHIIKKGKTMKRLLILPLLIATQSAYAGFDFGQCSGSGTFEQQIDAYGGDYENTVLVGEIPAGLKGLHIELKSNKDVDIRLYGANNDKIVHWPNGILKKGSLETKPYKNVPITYSGYNGTNGQLGHEFIDINDTTPTAMTMKAFGYQAGYATVNYSWTGKKGCEQGSGSGHFSQDIPNRDIALAGSIPVNIDNLEVNLTSDKDIDIQLYGADGTAIIQWPDGLLNGPNVQNIDYHGMYIEWSGYNGVNRQKGHEYIKLTGKTTEEITMKVYGYQAGTAIVDYRWGTPNTGGNGTGECITRSQLESKIQNNEDVTHVNTSCITDMSGLFYNNQDFNQDISGWDVSNVTNMHMMFESAYTFNQPIGNWDVSNVTNMEGMFRHTTRFNQNIGNWDVSSVTNMKHMFSFSYAFNQPIGNWDVSNVTMMSAMFHNTGSFNQPIGNWDVSNVTTMYAMFYRASKFNQPINNWDVSKVTDYGRFSMYSALSSENKPSFP